MKAIVAVVAPSLLDDLLIRRIITTDRSPKLPKEDEIRRDVRVNRPITDDVFEYTPPPARP